VLDYLITSCNSFGSNIKILAYFSGKHKESVEKIFFSLDFKHLNNVFYFIFTLIPDLLLAFLYRAIAFKIFDIIYAISKYPKNAQNKPIKVNKLITKVLSIRRCGSLGGNMGNYPPPRKQKKKKR
jgi:hypothetical protein